MYAEATERYPVDPHFVVSMLRLLKDIPWIHVLDISCKVVAFDCGTFHSISL